MSDAPAGVRRGDQQARLDHARGVAWRALNRRERTELELRGLLADKRVEPPDADMVLAELRDSGYVDDARFALQFTEERRRLDAWGATRIERRLRGLGIDRELIDAALATRDDDGELAAAVAVLERRLTRPPLTPRERDRALGILVRKGYDLELAHDALRRYAGTAEPS